MPGAILLAAIDLRRKQKRDDRLKKRFLRDLSNPLEMDEKLLNKRAFRKVFDEVAPRLLKSSIPDIIQITAVLRFLAVGSYQGVIANGMSISIGGSTFCKILWNVMNSLEETCSNWIQISLGSNAQSASKSHFYQQFGIPGVVGCVDGTHIRIMKPPTDNFVYFNRKGYYSINAMIICDNEMRILTIDASKPGSCHDSFVWKMSAANRHYANIYSEGARNFLLLGDSGYPLKPFLLTPYKSPTFATAQHTFNLRHASARNVVERTIGVLKSRFRCLQSFLMYTPSKVATIVNVCCALHNICKHYNIPLDEEINSNAEDIEFGMTEQDEDDSISVALRDNIARSLHSNTTL